MIHARCNFDGAHADVPARCTHLPHRPLKPTSPICFTRAPMKDWVIAWPTGGAAEGSELQWVNYNVLLPGPVDVEMRPQKLRRWEYPRWLSSSTCRRGVTADTLHLRPAGVFQNDATSLTGARSDEPDLSASSPTEASCCVVWLGGHRCRS